MLATTMSKASAKNSTDSQRIRRKYPDKVPIICVDHSGANLCTAKPSKLLVPQSMTGKGLLKAVYDKVPGSEGCVLMLGSKSQFPLKEDALICDLDHAHMHEDGFLYVTLHTEQQAKQLQEAFVETGFEGRGRSSSSPRPSLEVFNMADEDPDADDDKATDQSGSRLKRVLKKNPDRVPVRCRQDADTRLGLPSIDKKLLAPSKMLFSEFEKVVHKYVPKPSDPSAKLYVEGSISLEIDAPMAEIHEAYKADDGLLYVAYGVPVREQPLSDPDEKKEISVELQEQVMKQLQKVQQASEEDILKVRRAAEKDITELSAEKEKMLTEMGTLRSTLPCLYGEIANRDAEIDKHKCQADKLQGQLEEMTSKFEQAESERAAWISSYSEQASAKDLATSELATFKELANGRAVELERLQASSGVEIEQLSAQLLDMVGALQSTKLTAEQEALGLQEKVAGSETEVRDLKAQLEDVIGQSHQLQDTRAMVEKEVLSIKSKLEAEQESLRAQMQKVAAERDSIREAGERAMKELSSRHLSEIESFKTQAELSSTEVQSKIRAEVLASSETNTALQQTIAKQEAELQDARAESAKHHDEVAALRAQLEKLEKKADDDWEVLETPEEFPIHA